MGPDLTTFAHLLEAPDIDPRLLARACSPGRVRGIAVDTWTAVMAEPKRGGGTLRRAMREARALHSRERRFVSDALYDLVRWHRLLEGVAPEAEAPAMAVWLGWLVHLGLPVDDAAAAYAEVASSSVDFGAFTRLPQALASRVAEGHIGVALGVDDEAAAALVASLGDDLWAHLGASNARAPIALRANTGRISRDELLARLHNAGVQAEPGRWAPHAVRVPSGTHLPTALPGMQGAYEAQDEASQLVAGLLAVKPGERVLDYCAGAGGKTLALGAALGGQGTLWATDVRSRALGELKQRARAAGIKVRTAVLRDGTPSCDLGPAFDAVLVDAPCTGSGVWRRHPELRWRLADLADLQATQDAVFEGAAAQVRPGGRMVYATCSVLRDEDEARVAAFLQRHPNFHLSPALAVLPGLDAGLVDGPFLRAWPHRHGTDGFFAAVFDRLG